MDPFAFFVQGGLVSFPFLFHFQVVEVFLGRACRAVATDFVEMQIDWGAIQHGKIAKLVAQVVKALRLFLQGLLDAVDLA